MTPKELAMAYVEIKKRLDARQSSEVNAVLFLMENDIYEAVKAEHDIIRHRFDIRTLEKKKADSIKDLEKHLNETGIMKCHE